MISAIYTVNVTELPASSCRWQPAGLQVRLAKIGRDLVANRAPHDRAICNGGT